MPFGNPSTYSFDRSSVVENAPELSGVYGLFDRNYHPIYVGETENIQERLLHHLLGTDPCIGVAGPQTFTFEISPAQERVRRQDELILELKPLCNDKLG